MVIEQFRQINRFYKSHKLNSSVNTSDRVFYKSYKDEIVAVAFLREIKSAVQQPYFLFRSLFVAPEYRGQGLARELISQSIQVTQSSIYTICSQDLMSLYAEFGFKVCTSAPAEIAKFKTKKSPIIMLRLRGR